MNMLSNMSSPTSKNKSTVQPSLNLQSINKTNSSGDSVVTSTTGSITTGHSSISTGQSSVSTGQSSISTGQSSPLNKPAEKEIPLYKRSDNNESGSGTSSSKTQPDQDKQGVISNAQPVLLAPQPSSALSFEYADNYDTRTDDNLPGTVSVTEKAHPLFFVADMPFEVLRTYKAEVVTTKVAFVAEVQSKPEQVNWIKDTLTQAKPIVIHFLTESPLIGPIKLSTITIGVIGNPVEILETQLVRTLQKEIFERERRKYEALMPPRSSITDRSQLAIVSPTSSPATPTPIQVQKEKVENLQGLMPPRSSITDRSQLAIISPTSSPATPTPIQVQKEKVENLQRAPAEQQATMQRAPIEQQATTQRAPTEQKATPQRAPTEQQATTQRAPAEQQATMQRAPTEQQAAMQRAPTEQQATTQRAPTEQKATPQRAPTEQQITTQRAPAEQQPTMQRAPTEQQATTKRAPAEQQATSLSQVPPSIESKNKRMEKVSNVPCVKETSKTSEKSVESQKPSFSFVPPPPFPSTTDKSSPLPSSCQTFSQPSPDIESKRSSDTASSSPMLFERSSETGTVPTSSKATFGSFASSDVSSQKSSVPSTKTTIGAADSMKSVLPLDDEYFYNLILTMNFVRQVDDTSSGIPVCNDCGYLKLYGGLSEKCSRHSGK